MYYGALKKTDIANGPGVRVSLFVSGCTHHCKDCFNPETWNFKYGEEYTDKVTEEVLEALEPSYIKGLTILGGEPFEPDNQRGLLELYRQVKETYPQKSIWVYSGYTLEKDLLSESRARIEITDEILSMIDVLVDGEFVLEQKNITLKFRGSENQRIIRLQESLAAGETILLNDDEIK
ncbi:MAG: anaerobic ribonucleoside-triphosphate reductase activating protein [Eubacterium sp.]|nr:anaerobic ribonucleoside-triphosphate reductase activating protein [Eubacterium sp.]